MEMKPFKYRVSGRRTMVLAAAMVAGLWLARPAQAQLGLPKVVAPVTTPVLQTLPSLPVTPSVLPAVPTQPPPALQPLPSVPPMPNLQQVLPPPPQSGLSPQLPAVMQPGVAVPQTDVTTVLRPAASAVSGADSLRSPVPLQQLRANTVRDLLRLHPDLLEADPAGEPMRRGELLWVSPPPALLTAALALGFGVLREHALPDLNLRELVLVPPPGMGTAQGLIRLRALGPGVEADFNHVYTRSGESVGSAAPASGHQAAPTPVVRLGLIDGGVERQYAVLRGATLNLWGCEGVAHPSAHGSAVASLLVGRGATTGAVLYAADIYCGHPAGGAVETIVLALAWLARENVAVINISLVGPPNRLLERAVQAMLAKGHLVVAAVGNDGPAAPPLYPAAYAGVVGVTAVNQVHQVLPEAAQGPQVVFAALGAGLAVPESGGGYALVRGTSFAAPQVASLLAQEGMAAPSREGAVSAMTRLIAKAVDLGAPGRDPVYGWGLVGTDALRR